MTRLNPRAESANATAKEKATLYLDVIGLN